MTPSVQEFAGRIAHTLQRYPYLVAQNEDGELLGYAYASAFKSREAYDWSVELSVYVKTEYTDRVWAGFYIQSLRRSYMHRMYIISVHVLHIHIQTVRSFMRGWDSRR